MCPVVAYDEAPMHCPLQVVSGSRCIATIQPYFSTHHGQKSIILDTNMGANVDAFILVGLRLASLADGIPVFIQNVAI